MENKILIVDDSEIMRETVSDYCIDLDYSPETVASGEAALDILDRREFELVFLDVHLPGMDGLETVVEIHKLRPKQKIVLMTTDRGEELFDKASSGGYSVKGFINKPFSLGIMRVCLRTVLELKGVFRHRKEGYR